MEIVKGILISSNFYDHKNQIVNEILDYLRKMRLRIFLVIRFSHLLA